MFGKGANEFYNRVRKGERWPRPEECPAQLYELMRQCWEYNQDRRPNFQQCCERYSMFCRKPGLIFDFYYGSISPTVGLTNMLVSITLDLQYFKANEKAACLMDFVKHFVMIIL